MWKLDAGRGGGSALSLLADYKEASSWSQMYDAGYKNIVNLDVSRLHL